MAEEIEPEKCDQCKKKNAEFECAECGGIFCKKCINHHDCEKEIDDMPPDEVINIRENTRIGENGELEWANNDGTFEDEVGFKG